MKFRYKILLLLVLPIVTFSQNITNKFSHLTIRDGLSQISIYSLLQDKKGFIWIGTLDGLNRYDGYNYKIFRHDITQTNSIIDNSALCLFEDKNGYIWVGTYGGLSIYDPSTETFNNYFNIPNNPNSIINNTVRSITIDKKNRIWIGTDGGIDRFDETNKTFIHYKERIGINNNELENIIWKIYITKKNEIFAGTTYGLFKYNENTDSFEKFSFENNGYKVLNNQKCAYESDFVLDENQLFEYNEIRTIFEDSKNNLWIGTTRKGVFKISDSRNRITNFTSGEANNCLQSNEIKSIIEDKENNIWIGNYGGLSKYNPINNTFNNFSVIPNNPLSISSNKVYTLMQDKSGIIWIGTYDGGVNILDSKKEKFKHYYKNNNSSNNLVSNIVLSIFQNIDGDLWIGTDKGLNILDRKSNIYRFLIPKKSKNKLLNNSVIRAIFKDKEGIFWFGTERNGLIEYFTESKKLINYTHNPLINNGLANNKINVIFQDNTGLIWIGTNEGLNSYNKTTKIFKKYRNIKDDPNSLSNNIVWSITQDKDNVIWIGTQRGLNKYDDIKDNFKIYKAEPENPKKLSNGFVRNIYEDQNGILWLATSGGLIKFDNKKDIFKTYSIINGLSNNLVYSILQDNTGCLWLSTNYGISKFNPLTEEFNNYDETDGLQSNEFNQGAYYKSIKGELFFGGVNGLNAFFPSEIIKNQYIPPVVITDFKIFNKSVEISSNKESLLKKSITETKEITLSYTDNVFSFEFAALNYTNSYKNQYQYMMVGFDENWSSINNRRYVNYTNLKPGKYTFRVRGSNNEGVWNENGVSIDVYINPPFWQTYWFYFIAISLFICSIYLYIKIRMLKLKKEKLFLENKVKERTLEIELQNLEIAMQRDSLIALNIELTKQKDEVTFKSIELEKINQTLEEKVKEELQKNREKDMLIIQQSRQAALGEMIGNIAHQWRQPLNAVGIIIQNIHEAHIYKELDSDYLEKKVYKGMEIINYMSQTIDDFRNFFKPDKEKQLFNIKESILKALSFIDASFKSNNITIIQEIDANLQIIGYPNEYSQVIMYILKNSKDAFLERNIKNPLITIILKSLNDKSFLSIRDNAGGINEEHIEKIFEPYFSTKDIDKGTGIGLYMSKMIIEKNMDGKIYAVNHDDGAEFIIEI